MLALASSHQLLRASPALLAASFALACASAPDASHQEPQHASSSALRPEPGGAPGRHQPGVTADCQAWATRKQGRYRYENNIWGSKKAQGKFEQCLLTRERGGRTEVGWTWSWPGFDPSVFAYPEVVVGWKPWSGGASTDPSFPLRVSKVQSLSLDYEVETEVTGSYDLAPEIWLTNAPASERANPKSITTEVMFWMDYTEGARPAGEVIDHFELNGTTYELWKEDSIGADANGVGWRLLSFKSPRRQLQGSIDIAALLRYLVSRNLVDPSDYVASVEFGNEVMGGTGTTWLRRFDLRVGSPGSP